MIPVPGRSERGDKMKQAIYKYFMSYNGRLIYYARIEDKTIYSVADGKGSAEYFETFEAAMAYIDNKKEGARK